MESPLNSWVFDRELGEFYLFDGKRVAILNFAQCGSRDRISPVSSTKLNLQSVTRLSHFETRYLSKISSCG